MDNPGDAKYGMTTEQIFDAFRILKSKGAREFGIHAFLASNTVTNDYYPMLAKVMFELAVKLQKETGAHIKFINLSGGIGIPYRPEQTPNDIRAIGEGVRKVCLLYTSSRPQMVLWLPEAILAWRFLQVRFLISRK